MKKLLILSVILALCGVGQAVIDFQDTFDHAMDDGWAQLNYLDWYTGEHPNWGPWSIGRWDNFICIPDPTTGVVAGIDVQNYVPAKNVKYDAPYPLIPYTEAGMKNYWENELPNGTYPAPDVYYNSGMGEADTTQAWFPGDPLDMPVLNGKLIMASTGGGWENTMNTGPFLYKNVAGNFDAYVEVVGFDYWYHNQGGIMARAPNANEYLPDGGTYENWVSVCAFPLWNNGNRGNNTVNGATNWIGINGYPTLDFLKLSRRGTVYSFYAGDRVPGQEAGGPLVWTLLGSVDRPDLPEELQVGIYQCNFTTDWKSTMEFDNFLLVPEPATIALLGLGAIALIRRKR